MCKCIKQIVMIIFLLVFCVINISCSAQNNPEIKLLLSSNRLSYSKGDDIILTLTVTSNSAQPICFNTRMTPNRDIVPEAARDIYFKILSPTNIELIQKGINNPSMMEDKFFIDLIPGGIYSKAYNLHAVGYSLTVEGKYRISVSYQNYRDPTDGRKAWHGKLESNTITIEIVD